MLTFAALLLSLGALLGTIASYSLLWPRPYKWPLTLAGAVAVGGVFLFNGQPLQLLFMLLQIPAVALAIAGWSKRPPHRPL